MEGRKPTPTPSPRRLTAFPVLSCLSAPGLKAMPWAHGCALDSCSGSLAHVSAPFEVDWQKHILDDYFLLLFFTLGLPAAPEVTSPERPVSRCLSGHPVQARCRRGMREQAASTGLHSYWPASPLGVNQASRCRSESFLLSPAPLLHLPLCSLSLDCWLFGGPGQTLPAPFSLGHYIYISVL